MPQPRALRPVAALAAGVGAVVAVALAAAACASNATSTSNSKAQASTVPSAAPSVQSAAAPPAASTSAPAAPSSAAEFDSPSGLVFATGRLWVTNVNGNSVTEIDPSSGASLATFRDGGYQFNQPAAIATDGTNLFVANAGGSVTELRASDGAVVRTISGAQFGFANPVAITIAGGTILVLNEGRGAAVPGSITEIDAATGNVIRMIRGAGYAFADPVAFVVSGSNVFVADKANNSVTEANIADGNLVRTITSPHLGSPDGIVVSAGRLWVSNASRNAATEFDPATGNELGNFSDADGDYGFGSPSVAIESAGNVYIASPFGTSPMVTKLSATSGSPSWYMCNTNGPYYFSLLSAMAISGDDIWVASRTGDNSQTPGAKTGALTEFSATTGALIKTLPRS